MDYVALVTGIISAIGQLIQLWQQMQAAAGQNGEMTPDQINAFQQQLNEMFASAAWQPDAPGTPTGPFGKFITTMLPQQKLTTAAIAGAASTFALLVRMRPEADQQAVLDSIKTEHPEVHALAGLALAHAKKSEPAK